MKKNVDYTLFFTVLFLIIFWMIMISSVSIFTSDKVTSSYVERWLITEAYNYFYVRRNIIHVITALLWLWLIVKIHYSFFERNSKYIFGFIVSLLVIVLVKWNTLLWARWWIDIPWLPSIQPTEFLKLALIIFLASFFSSKTYLWYWWKTILSFIWLTIIIIITVLSVLWIFYLYWFGLFTIIFCGLLLMIYYYIYLFILSFYWIKQIATNRTFNLILNNKYLVFTWIIWLLVWLVWLQPDFWTIMVIVPVSTIMFFYSWANLKYFWVLWVIWLILSFSVYSAWDYDKSTWKNLNSLWYITQRIDNFLANNQEAIKNKTINYQTEQALIAIWSWGFKWLWFGQSIQKHWWLPEVQWDFIFSVIVEELWFIWGFIILLFYVHIGYRWFYIASRVSDLFWKYIAVWISSWIMIQAFINIWVNLNIVPLTWITLPFISYGWSSLLSLMIALWILLNVSRYMENKQQYSRINKRKYMF